MRTLSHRDNTDSFNKRLLPGWDGPTHIHREQEKEREKGKEKEEEKERERKLQRYSNGRYISEAYAATTPATSHFSLFFFHIQRGGARKICASKKRSKYVDKRKFLRFIFSTLLHLSVEINSTAKNTILLSSSYGYLYNQIFCYKIYCIFTHRDVSYFRLHR